MAKQKKDQRSELQKAADIVRDAELDREIYEELVKDAVVNCNTAKLELVRREKLLEELTDKLYAARNNVTRSIQYVHTITNMNSYSPNRWGQKEIVCGSKSNNLY